MKKNAIILFLLLLSCSEAFAALDSAQSANRAAAQDSLPLKRIFLIHCDHGPGLDSVSMGKAYAAMNLVAEFTRKYELIDPEEIDSTATALAKQRDRITAVELARALRADLSVQIRVSRLANILRSDMILMRGDSLEKRVFSKGYDFIRYRSVKDDATLLDPALLRSFQRAFASALGDSALYDSLPEKFAVRPSRTVVISGFEYKDNPDIKPQWDLFTDKMHSSFYMSDKIFEYGHESKRFVLFDLESRDTIFALNNMHFVENFKSVSMAELKLFDRFDVECVVSGEVERSEEGARLTLYLLSIRGGNVYLDKTATGVLKEDNLKDVDELIKKLTQELFGS